MCCDIKFNSCGNWFYLPVVYLIIETIVYLFILPKGYNDKATYKECAVSWVNLEIILVLNGVLIKSMFDNLYATKNGMYYDDDNKYYIHAWTWIIWIFWSCFRFWSFVAFCYIQANGLVDDCFDDIRLYHILVESAIVFIVQPFIFIMWGFIEAIKCCVICDREARERRRKSDLAKTKKALEEKNKEVELREIKIKEFEQKLENEQTKRKIAEEKLRDETSAIPVAIEPTVAKVVTDN